MADFNDSPTAAADSTRPFHDDYLGYDPRLPSQRFGESQRFDDSFSIPDDYGEHFTGGDEKPGIEVEDGYEQAPGFQSPAFNEHTPEGQESPSPFDEHIPQEAGGFSPVSDHNDFTAPPTEGYEFSPAPPAFGSGNGSVLPPLEEMEPEEGHLLREWKRQNAIHLEEKERKERERLEEIMDEAETFKANFYKKRAAHCEAQKKNNRDKEQVFSSSQEHFHKNASKHYWKAVSELVPNEVPSIETKRGKDRDKKKTTVIFNQGPKPGKATDMARMRQILLKLKHNPPAHMKTAPPPPPPEKPKEEADKKDKAEPAAAAAAAPAAAPVEVAA